MLNLIRRCFLYMYSVCVFVTTGTLQFMQTHIIFVLYFLLSDKEMNYSTDGNEGVIASGSHLGPADSFALHVWRTENTLRAICN